MRMSKVTVNVDTIKKLKKKVILQVRPIKKDDRETVLYLVKEEVKKPNFIKPSNNLKKVKEEVKLVKSRLLNALDPELYTKNIEEYVNSDIRCEFDQDVNAMMCKYEKGKVKVLARK